MLERDYQAGLIRRLKDVFPGCIVLKNDSSHTQGIPDLTLLWGPYWAMLEVKASRDYDLQPNQEYYVGKADEMSFGAFIYPENEEAVIDALQHAFRQSRRKARVS